MESFGDWELCAKIGSGAFGEIHYWKNRRTKLEIAIKSLKRNKTLRPDEENKMKIRWVKENDFLMNFDKDFIVRGLKLTDMNFLNYLNGKHAWNPLKVLVTEYCNGGDLRKVLQNIDNLNGLKEFDIREVLRTLRHAIYYMHNDCKIQHRDLKPDNIIIHVNKDGKRIFKIADFGFASVIIDRTMLQSVVGTRNYLAPEVIDTSEYTRTVDYWSAGIIAFELVCGTLPFIPHQTLFNTIKAVKAKPNNCIAITENFSKKDSFENHEKIFEENHISSIFRKKIEYWLRLALDKNFRTRGMDMEFPNAPGNRVLKFYSALDELLGTRVLTVFSLNTYSFYDFEISLNTNFVDFKNNLSRATKIPENNLIFIPPIGHRLKRSSDAKQPFDFYMENWQDTTNPSNPPVMLFVADVDNKNNAFRTDELKISDAIKYCCRLNANDVIPQWLNQKIAYDIHYFLTNEQRHLTTMLLGIKEYAMNIEDEMLNDASALEMLQFNAYYVKGRLSQCTSIIEGVKDQLTENTAKMVSQSLNENIHLNIDKTLQAIVRLNKRFKSALYHMKEEANSNVYEELIKKDDFKTENFRNHLLAEHQGLNHEILLKQITNCRYCRDAVFKCLEKRDSIFKGIVSKILTKVANIHEEYRSIQSGARLAEDLLKRTEIDIQQCTNLLNKEFVDTIKAQKNNNMLVTDGNKVLSSSFHLMNGNCDLMEVSAMDLIKQATENMQRMTMDLDDMPNGFREVPTTVNSNHGYLA